MNEKSRELCEEEPPIFGWSEMLAFTAVWLHMDATPFRDRRQYWSSGKFKYGSAFFYLHSYFTAQDVFVVFQCNYC